MMGRELFPQEPQRRRAIVVLRRHDIQKCGTEPGEGQILLDDEAHVMEFPLASSAQATTALSNIVAAGLVRPGSVLVQSPFDSDSYEDASLAPERFAVAKHFILSNLCRLLGATKVSIDQIDLKRSDETTSFDAKASRLGVNAQASMEKNKLDTLRAQLNLCDTFVGGTPDIEAAEALLRSCGVWQDSNMRSLVDMRRAGPNSLTQRKLVVSLSSDAKKNLNVAAKVKIPSFVKLDADYTNAIRERYDYTLTVIVDF